MINCLIKYLHIIFFKETFIVKQLKFVVFDKFIKYYENSRKVINDKDKFFTLNY